MPRHVPLLVLSGALFAAPAAAGVVINEVMPSPHADWSGDARSSAVDDEWVELANAGSDPQDLAALYLADGDRPATPRVGFEGTLAPGATRFVTGEHALDWQSAHGGSAEGLALDDRDEVALYRVAGGTAERLDALTWDATVPDVSWGRMPDGTGVFAAFDALAGGGGPQPTPGGANGGIATPKILDTERRPAAPTSADEVRVRARAGDADGVAACVLVVRLDGGVAQELPMTLVDGTTSLGTWEAVMPAQPAGRSVSYHVRVSDGALLAQTNDDSFVVSPAAGGAVALNEILADPPPDPEGDANGDGVRHSADDEFIEIVNHGTAPVDLSAWSLADSAAVRHVFPEGLVLAPGAMYVVFGGGTITGIPSGADVASTGGLSLNNTSDQVRLLDAAGGAQDSHAYGSEANADQSLIRIPDGSGAWTRPLDAGLPWRYSPGALNAEPAAVEAASWARIKALYAR